MSIEVKDKDLDEAAQKTIDLIKKYDRYHSTAVGSDSTKLIEKMIKMDPKICTIFGTADGMKLIFGFFTGILPFLSFNRDLAALPYMTRDFIKMKFEERRQAQSFG